MAYHLLKLYLQQCSAEQNPCEFHCGDDWGLASQEATSNQRRGFGGWSEVDADCKALAAPFVRSVWWRCRCRSREKATGNRNMCRRRARTGSWNTAPRRSSWKARIMASEIACRIVRLWLQSSSKVWTRAFLSGGSIQPPSKNKKKNILGAFHSWTVGSAVPLQSWSVMCVSTCHWQRQSYTR